MIMEEKRGLRPHRAYRATPPEYLFQDEAEDAGA
jgi:hypothetical protein